VARPPDPDRRARTLTKAADYVLTHGLSGLSLRPLAAALGTSTRMLLYDFGSKEQLVTSVLAEVRRRQAEMYMTQVSTVDLPNRDTARLAWEWMSAEEHRPYARLLFEVYVDAMRRPEAYQQGASGIVGDWLKLFGAGMRGEEQDDLDVTIVVAILRGLLLDRMTAADPERVDRAFEKFNAMLRG
jgi:AcrR family transcriptional regulator